MRKIYLFLLMLIVGIGSTWADDVTYVPGKKVTAFTTGKNYIIMGVFKGSTPGYVYFRDNSFSGNLSDRSNLRLHHATTPLAATHVWTATSVDNTSYFTLQNVSNTSYYIPAAAQINWYNKAGQFSLKSITSAVGDVALVNNFTVGMVDGTNPTKAATNVMHCDGEASWLDYTDGDMGAKPSFWGAPTNDSEYGTGSNSPVAVTIYEAEEYSSDLSYQVCVYGLSDVNHNGGVTYNSGTYQNGCYITPSAAFAATSFANVQAIAVSGYGVQIGINNKKIIVCYTKNITTTTISNSAFSNPTWYTIKNQDAGYISSSNVNNSGNLLLSNTTYPTTTNGVWCVVGDATNGYQFYNKADGTSKVIKNANDDATTDNAKASMTTSTTDTCSYYNFVPSLNGATGAWILEEKNAANNCWNNRDNYLSSWYSEDGYNIWGWQTNQLAVKDNGNNLYGAIGSQYIFEEADLYLVNVTAPTGCTGGGVTYGNNNYTNGSYIIIKNGTELTGVSAVEVSGYVPTTPVIDTDNKTVSITYAGQVVSTVSKKITNSELVNNGKYVLKLVGDARSGWCYFGKTSSSAEDANLYADDTPDVSPLRFTHSEYILTATTSENGSFTLKYNDGTNDWYVKENTDENPYYSFTTTAADAVSMTLVAKSGCDAGIWNIKTASSYFNADEFSQATVPVTSKYIIRNYNIEGDTNGKWELYRVNYTAETISYTLTDEADNSLTGTYSGTNGSLPDFEGCDGYSLSNIEWSTTNGVSSFTADVTFPFAVSSATTKNYVYIYTDALTNGKPYFKITDGAVKTRATGQYTDGTYLPTNQSGENEKWEWAFIPSLTNGKFTFKIYNASAQQYAAFTATTATVESMSVGDSGSDFCYGPTNINSGYGFYLADYTDIFFTANSTNEGEQDAWQWKKSGSHKGANLHFATPADFSDLITKLTTANTKANDYTSYMGTGLGMYTATESYSSAKTQAAAIVASGSTTYATAAQITEYTNILNNKTGLTINAPEANKFYKFKHSGMFNKDSRVKYYNGSNNNVVAYDKDCIFFYDGSHLLQYSTGYYGNGTTVASEVVETPITYSFPDGRVYGTHSNGKDIAPIGTYGIHGSNMSGSIGYWESSGARDLTADNWSAWYIEEVDELPITLAEGKKYSTFYSPVAVTLPSENNELTLKAYTAKVNDDLATVAYTTVGKVIPANTGVLIKRAATDTDAKTYNLTVGGTATVTEGTGDLKGAEYTQTFDYSSQKIGSTTLSGKYVYTLQSGTFTGFNGTQLTGFKSHLELAANPADPGARQYTSLFADEGESTGITSISNEINNTVDGKYIENGRIIIVKNGVKYNTNGQTIK